MIKNDRRNQSPQNFAHSQTQSGSHQMQNNQGSNGDYNAQPQRNYAHRTQNHPSNSQYQGGSHPQASQQNGYHNPSQNQSQSQFQGQHQSRHPSAPRRTPSSSRPQQHRPYQSLRNQTIDSNGPEVRIRGTIYQIFEKYASLARENAMGGDRVLAENLLQHAEHYMRLINDVKAEMATEQTQGQRQEQKQNVPFQVPTSLPNALPNALPSALQGPLNLGEDLTKYQPIL